MAGINKENIHVGADVNGDGKVGTEEVIFVLRNMGEIASPFIYSKP